LLKPLADLTTLTEDEFVDWGHQETFATAIGVGECAGVVIDLVATLLFESDEKLGWANEAFTSLATGQMLFIMLIIHSSARQRHYCLDKNMNSSTQTGIIREFDAQYVRDTQEKFASAMSHLTTWYCRSIKTNHQKSFATKLYKRSC
jgi:sulfite reductase (ferredoxin)